MPILYLITEPCPEDGKDCLVAFPPSMTTLERQYQYRHSGKNAKNAPRGALQFWSGGSKGYGHVTVANGRGKSWGVDLPASGKIGMVPTDEVAARWGLRYLGWIWADEVAGW